MHQSSHPARPRPPATDGSRGRRCPCLSAAAQRGRNQVSDGLAPPPPPPVATASHVLAARPHVDAATGLEQQQS